jgi:hypothetical protein
MWVMAGLVLAALLAILRPTTRLPVLWLWGVALVAVIGAFATTRLALTPPASESPVVGWPGTLTAIAGGALIACAALASDGLRASMAESAFSWRQPVAGLTTVAAVLTPVLALLWWLPGSGDPLRRGDPVVLPAFVVAEAIGPEAPRTLVLRPVADGRVDYALVNGTGPRLGDAEVEPAAEDWAELDRLVAGLVSGRGGDEVAGLASYAVRYVVLEQSAASGRDIGRSLDSVPGLRRVAGRDGEVLWRVEGETSRVVVADSASGDATPVPLVRLGSAEPFVDAPVSAPATDVRLAQTADPAWRAVLDGVVLAPVDSGDVGAGLQAFELPAGASGQLVVDVDDSPRTRWLWAQAIAWVVVAILALPARRSSRDDDADDDVDPDGEAAETDEAAQSSGDAQAEEVTP